MSDAEAKERQYKLMALPPDIRSLLRHACLLAGVAATLAILFAGALLLPPLDPLALAVLTLSLVLTMQSLFTVYLMLYSWEHPDRLAATSGPRSLLAPQLSFTVLLPARHEEAVISETIRHVVNADYPPDLVEAVVICHADDTGTIAEAQRAIQDLGANHIRVQTFTGGTINKPHGLNVGLSHTTNAVVAVFDAEDDIDPSIFNVINTIMLQEDVNIVQAGVQLMNFRDHWFAPHNVIEYYFWFKSRLHFHARVGMIPLGGNTIFIKRKLIDDIGGWDERCLTEDADIGLRLSSLAEKIRVVYDAQHVTREETPDTVASLVRQRTRWHQGFLQVLRKGTWSHLPTFSQRLLAVYTFTYPIIHALVTLMWPVSILAILFLKLPISVAIVSFFPLYALFFQFVATVIGIYIFTREYGFRFPMLMPLHMALTYLPYQWLLSLSSVRAFYREMRNRTDWEKTEHIGAHRLPGIRSSSAEVNDA